MKQPTWFSGWVEGLIAGVIIGGSLGALVTASMLHQHPHLLEYIR